jgi:hypothetical protein
MSKEPKYTLWRVEHESIYSVYLYKVRDTSSTKEVDKWMGDGGTASFYREEDCLNAMYVQCFQEC